jgi:hypothetical protein
VSPQRAGPRAAGFAVPNVVDLDDQAHWVETLRKVRREIAELHAEEQQIITNLKHRIGDAQEGQIAGTTVITYRWSKPVRRLDLVRLRRQAPQIWQAYSVTKTPVRRFVLLPEYEPMTAPTGAAKIAAGNQPNSGGPGTTGSICSERAEEIDSGSGLSREGKHAAGQTRPNPLSCNNGEWSR